MQRADKKHETAFHTTIAQALTYYRSTEPKGECVLVIEEKTERTRAGGAGFLERSQYFRAYGKVS